ncbi:hypothetical protein [Marinobacterium iners]|uniref:DNA-binding transcriptional regulator, IclR family n=1 Tax=Marinobacterium iners DSM 11526 TaxID=1122198 RepID=A0A1H4GQU6_9GAMM|nr:hypothetical protein [Marinobacterium iners]SEB11907.1 DNA-binding transcriptional regulator, IclR family [Marinobacterium iners DSM 11526]
MTTKSFEKAKVLIELLSSSTMDAAGLETLHILSGYPKPTIKRIMDDLQALRVIYRRLGDKRYVVLGFENESFDPVYLLARDIAPVLHGLFRKTGLLSDFVMVRDGQPVIVESNFSLSCYRSASSGIIGARPSPLLSAAGRTLYAERTDVKVELDAVTEPLVDSLLDEKQQAVYTRVDDSWEYGFDKPFAIAACAVPVRFEKQTVAALSLYWDAARVRQGVLNHDIQRALRSAADTIELLLPERNRLYRKAALDLS